jgi:hypothetical protein
MKNKHKSLLSVIAITCAVGVPLSLTTAHELPVQAYLTQPAGWDYRYKNTDSTNYTLSTSTTAFAPSYTRTAVSGGYTYTTTFDVIAPYFEVSQEFYLSNTTWLLSGGAYYPTANNIGTNAGSNDAYFEISFENYTLNDYKLYFDTSSNATYSRVYNYDIFIDPDNITNNLIFNNFNLLNILIPSYTTITIKASPSPTIYFDAWYLEDLGVSSGYSQGYIAGEAVGYADGLENSNVLIRASESLFGMMINFTYIIFSLEMFGVSILSIVGVLFGIVAITWILKTIRG